MHTTSGRARAAVAAVAAGTLLALSAPLSASAHVSLETDTASPGTFTTLTFRVPDESTDGAGTNKLTLTLPEATPLASVSYIPVPGWTTELTTTELAKPVTTGDATTTRAVTRVTWTAQSGSELGAGSLGLFRLFVGPVPDTGSLKLPVDQQYTDGTIVSWNGAAGAEHPAPVLYVNDPPAKDDDADSAPEVTAAPAQTTAAQPDVLARVLGILGLVVGAVGIVVAVTGRRTSKSDS
ncbi:MAG TPA: DUF1775 domain-containing protein [Pseudolysinimonas sp.]|nr:DUF1775 domain-containing protein [Pseudolysinimonas sp.]